MERVILARHGESVFSAQEIVNGDPAVPGGLTDAGVEQARSLGLLLSDERLDLLVTTEFERTVATAETALGDRGLPRAVIADLNDPRYGRFEGAQLAAYRAWASASPSSESPGEGGESRYAIVERFARGFAELLARPERSILLVAHSLPLAYALAARGGLEPAPRMPFAAYATPYRFTSGELESVVEVLGGWLAAPTF
ncbi:MAG TPA: histidine phosphatase family protein [Gaiellaceae bacterium]|jgi:probable phosphoglycerate mutase|nr:histidine phosphatase family protein [Gaiellaceae bacterium]